MQNTFTNKKNLHINNLKNKVTSLKGKIHEKFLLEEKGQMDSEEIINKLNHALTFNTPVTIQVRADRDSAYTIEMSGNIMQTDNGILYIEESKNRYEKIVPENIKHIA